MVKLHLKALIDIAEASNHCNAMLASPVFQQFHVPQEIVMSHGMRLAALSDLFHLPKHQFKERIWRLYESSIVAPAAFLHHCHLGVTTVV